MNFISFEFFILLIITAVAFYSTRKQHTQKLVLLLSSTVFICFFNVLSFVVLSIFTSLNFYLLKRLSHTTVTSKSKQLYFSGIAINTALLFIYKLLQDLISSSGIQLLEGFNNSKWILLGIGFYSIQVIGFYFDIYKRKQLFTLNPIDFSLAVSFFPKLPSGPILTLKQSANIFHDETEKFQVENIIYGIQRILLGLFKKVVLADRLLPFVNQIFDDHNYHNGFLIYLGPFLFTLQLYFDFSGYIDIALGSARIFNIKLPENFLFPLRAQSIVDFWRRWHITLVNWLTHYIFYPISFRYRKFKKQGIAIAVVCTFFVSAAWHGFAITFFIWALCHFTYIICENYFQLNQHKAKTSTLIKFVRVIFVWHLIAWSNLFFRSHSLNDVKLFFNDFMKLPFLVPDSISLKSWILNGGQNIENEFNLRLSILLCLLFLIYEKKITQYAFSTKYNIYYVVAMIVFITVFGMFNLGERFIYLQF
jgi:D-alanyl-lipoteichoic acid acyltransferase DltB (MBOAT superfamily)